MASDFQGHTVNSVDGRYQTITPSAPIQPQVASRRSQSDTTLNDVTAYGPWQEHHHIQLAPRSYVLRSFLVLIFCCPLFGFVAMLYGFQVDAHFDNNKLSEARFASSMARKLNIAGILVGILTIFAIIVGLSVGLSVGLVDAHSD